MGGHCRQNIFYPIRYFARIKKLRYWIAGSLPATVQQTLVTAMMMQKKAVLQAGCLRYY
jgi:hypothetical protein